jgi:hypothetical protein
MSRDKFQSISQDEYADLFELSKQKTGDGQSKQERALGYALEIRKFEIELYWKRAGYFWTFIAAALAGFMIIQKDTADKSTYLAIILGCLGLVFSFGWFCVNKGSKQWQENWENHVDLLEDGIIGPLYKVVTTRPEIDQAWWHPKGAWLRLTIAIAGPAAFSVSKINQIVSLFVTALWVVLIIHVLPLDTNQNIDWKYAVPIVVAVLACIVMLILGRTDTENYKGLRATKRVTTIRGSAANNGMQSDNR